MSDKETIDQLLNDNGFQKMVEDECGKPIKCKVDWAKNEIVIQGPKSGRVMMIDVTLAGLRKEFQ